MLKYALLTLPGGYNFEKERGGRKFEIEKFMHLTEQVFFEECLNYFYPWLTYTVLHLRNCDTYMSCMFKRNYFELYKN